jgi:hypothetical protein
MKPFQGMLMFSHLVGMPFVQPRAKQPMAQLFEGSGAHRQLPCSIVNVIAQEATWRTAVIVGV